MADESAADPSGDTPSEPPSKRRRPNSASVPSNEELQNMLSERAQARSSKDWATADKIKEDLRAAGVRVFEERGGRGGTFSTSDGRVGSFSADTSGFSFDASLSTEAIHGEIEKRHRARRERNWETADQIKNSLKANGVEVYDKPGVWRAKDGREGMYGDTGAASAPPRDHHHHQSNGNGNASWAQPPMGHGQHHAIMPHQPSPARMGGPPLSRSDEIQRALNVRETARRHKDWTTADRIKSQLLADGVSIDDKKGEWSTVEGWSGRSDGSGQIDFGDGQNGPPPPRLAPPQIDQGPRLLADRPDEAYSALGVQRDWQLLREWQRLGPNPMAVLMSLRATGLLDEAHSAWTPRRVQEQRDFLCRSVNVAARMVGKPDDIQELISLCM